MTTSLLSSTKRALTTWAHSTGCRTDGSGYCLNLDDNLFQSLHPDTRREFESGDGGELGHDGARGKMQALHSSSALGCNFFDYWRGIDSAPLARSLALSSRIESLRFEEKFPTGVGPKSPNLDVTLRLADGSLVGIESKFLEPYSGGKEGKTIQDKYFSADKERWTAVGLPAAQTLAIVLASGQKYSFLDAPQLLKHMLGLGAAGPTWRLLYVWYDPPSPETEEHRRELVDFQQALGHDGSRLRTVGYSQILSSIDPGPAGQHARYLSYLKSRYFSGVV